MKCKIHGILIDLSLYNDTCTSAPASTMKFIFAAKAKKTKTDDSKGESSELQSCQVREICIVIRRSVVVVLSSSVKHGFTVYVAVTAFCSRDVKL